MVLTKSKLISALWQALSRAGLDAAVFSGHSFRIGAASTAASQRMEDSTIKTLSQWQSDAYLRYIRLPATELASYSSRLVT